MLSSLAIIEHNVLSFSLDFNKLIRLDRIMKPVMQLCEYNLQLKSFNVSNSFNKVGIVEKLKIIMNLLQGTVGQLHKMTCKVFDLAPDEVAVYFDVNISFYLLGFFCSYCGHHWQVCIWDYYGRTKHSLMDSLDKTLDDANIQMDQNVSQTFCNHL
jgi:hypothetical protein